MEKNFRMTLYILPTKKPQRIPPIKKKKKKERKENSGWLKRVWCLSASLPLPLPHTACDWGFIVQYYENVTLNESFLPFSSVSFSCTH